MNFIDVLQKICSLRGWPAGHAKNKETHEAMLTIWEGLRSKADKDNDGQVSAIYLPMPIKNILHHITIYTKEQQYAELKDCAKQSALQNFET